MSCKHTDCLFNTSSIRAGYQESYLKWKHGNNYQLLKSRVMIQNVTQNTALPPIISLVPIMNELPLWCTPKYRERSYRKQKIFCYSCIRSQLSHVGCACVGTLLNTGDLLGAAVPHHIVFPVNMVHSSSLSPASLMWLHLVLGCSLGCECLFFAALLL